jgi:hypothetical protein
MSGRSNNGKSILAFREIGFVVKGDTLVPINPEVQEAVTRNLSIVTHLPRSPAPTTPFVADSLLTAKPK